MRQRGPHLHSRPLPSLRNPPRRGDTSLNSTRCRPTPRPVHPQQVPSNPHRPSPTHTAPQHPAVSSFEVYSTSAHQRRCAIQPCHVSGRRRTNLNHKRRVPHQTHRLKWVGSGLKSGHMPKSPFADLAPIMARPTSSPASTCGMCFAADTFNLVGTNIKPRAARRCPVQIVNSIANLHGQAIFTIF